MTTKCILTLDQYKNILANSLSNNGFHIIDIKERSLAKEIFGALGDHYKAYLKVQNGNEIITKQYFIKRIQSKFDIQNRRNKAQGAFKKEAFFYGTFLPELSKVSGCKADFAPECYLIVNDDFLVLEYLENFHIDKFNTFKLDLEHMRLLLDALAKFHAGSIIFEQVQSEKQKKPYSLYEAYPAIFEECLYREDEEYLGNKTFQTGIKSVLSLLQVMPQYSDRLEETKQKFLDAAKLIYELVKPSSRYRNVISHGDLWMHNFMYKYVGDKAVDFKLIDYQALRYTVPANDIAFVLHTQNDRDFRQKYEQELYKFYYDALKKHLYSCGIDITKHISFKEFLETTEYVIPYIVVQKMWFATQVCLLYNGHIRLDPVLFEEFFYGDRSEVTVNEYLKNEVYKRYMDDIFSDLNLLK